MKASGPQEVQPAWKPPDPGSNRRMGMLVFLVSLGMLFAASMVGYLVFRLTNPAVPPPGATRLPVGLWVSTLALLGAGLAMHRAARQAQRGHFPRLRAWLVRTWVLSAAFIAIQAPCLVQLLRAHQADLLENSPGLYGMAFALIAIHALHVLGGMVPLTLLTLKALRRRLDSEHLLSVRSCTAYWHFLEGVWAVLFGMFLLTA